MSFTDNFTGSDSQEITSRSGWTSIDYTAGTMLVKTNTLGQSGGTAGSVHCTDQGSTTCDTSADFDGIVGSNNTNIALCGVITDKNNLIGLRVPGAGATGTQFFKKISGTVTTLVSFQGVSGHTYKISRSGDTYGIYDNGTQKGTDQTVTGFSGTTYQGFAIIQAGSSYNSVGWDNFTAAATGGTGASVNLSGIAITSGIGTLIAKGGAKVSLGGLQITSGIGTLALKAGAKVYLSGLAIDGQIGTLTIVSGSGVAVTLTGLQINSGIGALSEITGAKVRLSGIQIDGAIGQIQSKGGAAVILTGQQILASLGSLGINIVTTVRLAGLSINAGIGILEITGGSKVTLTGQEVSSGIGSLTITIPTTNIVLPGYRIFTVEHEDRTFLILAESKTDTIH